MNSEQEKQKFQLQSERLMRQLEIPKPGPGPHSPRAPRLRVRRDFTRPEMSGLQMTLLAAIRERGKSNPISWRDLADWLKVDGRLVRKEIEILVNVYHEPICSSYSNRRPGYFMPQTPEEVAQTCRTMIRHGANIIKRARTIGKYSDEQVMGQLRMELQEKSADDAD